jgi:hypothetical protein
MKSTENLADNRERLNELLVELMKIMSEASKDNFSFDKLDTYEKINLENFKSLKNEFELRIELAHAITEYGRIRTAKTRDIFSLLHKKVSIPLKQKKIKDLKKKLGISKKDSAKSIAIKVANTFDSDSIDGSINLESNYKIIDYNLYNSENYKPGQKTGTDENFLELVGEVLHFLEYSKNRNNSKEHLEVVKTRIFELVSQRNTKFNSKVEVGRSAFTQKIGKIARKNPPIVKFDLEANQIYEFIPESNNRWYRKCY